MTLEDLEKWLDLYLKGRLPAKQKADMDNLLDDLHQERETPHDFTQGDVDRLWTRIDARTTPAKANRSWRWLAVAAAIAVVAAASVVASLWFGDSYSSEKIILADGTLVWLKGDATLSNVEGFSQRHREVSLTGEALFEVARDPAHPFVIHCGNYVASVLGTSFNIKATDSAVELTVLTGRVKIASRSTDEGVVVAAHEHVVFSGPDGLVSKVAPNTDEIKSIVANTQYDMHFEDTRMSEIARRVEGKFDVTIEFDNESLRNCMISADFTDQTLPLTLTMIAEALGVAYEIAGDRVIISGAGCPE